MESTQGSTLSTSGSLHSDVRSGAAAGPPDARHARTDAPTNIAPDPSDDINKDDAYEIDYADDDTDSDYADPEDE